MKICPNCHQFANENVRFCIFCGKRLSRRGRNSAFYSAANPKYLFTRAERAQRVLFGFSFALAAVTFSAILFSPPTERQLSAMDGSYSASSVVPDRTAPPQKDVFFDSVSGDYDVTIALSVVESDDPDMLAAAESIRGELFSGVLALTVDETGVGTALLQQMFFTPETISVSPFADKEGVLSQNTLYGYLVREEMKLSVVCVCEEGGVSGFIWMDSPAAHIEFLYYS